MKKLFPIFFWYILITVCAVGTLEAQTVYVTRTGEKYHSSGCQYLRRSKIAIELSDALDNRYTACSVCRPVTKLKKEKQSGGQPAKVPPVKPDPAVDQLPAVDAGVTQKEKPSTPRAPVTKSTQCTSMTKSGTRCKRTTTSASGKCWQHE